MLWRGQSPPLGAVADLVPGLHRRTGAKATATQTLLIFAGIATIALFHCGH